jgi:hypothetical protein
MSVNGHGTTNPDGTASNPTDAFMQRVTDLVDTFGWMAQGVFSTMEHPINPFMYSVGLHAHDHPELVIVGLGNETAKGILDVAARRVLDGDVFEPGRVYPDILSGPYTVVLRELERKEIDEHLGVAQRFAGENVAAFQIMWPDNEGVLPPSLHCKVLREQEFTDGH